LQLWLPGAHSSGPEEDGEHLPAWVKVFHKYFEEKKAQASRTEAQEAARIQIRTMQRTILPPPEPLVLGSTFQCIKLHFIYKNISYLL
jgi:hypothetical protein